MTSGIWISAKKNIKNVVNHGKPLNLPSGMALCMPFTIPEVQKLGLPNDNMEAGCWIPTKWMDILEKRNWKVLDHCDELWWHIGLLHDAGKAENLNQHEKGEKYRCRGDLQDKISWWCYTKPLLAFSQPSRFKSRWQTWAAWQWAMAFKISPKIPCTWQLSAGAGPCSSSFIHFPFSRESSPTVFSNLQPGTSN